MTEQTDARSVLEEKVGQLAWDYRAARLQGREFDIEKALTELPEEIRDKARKLLLVGKFLLDADPRRPGGSDTGE